MPTISAQAKEVMEDFVHGPTSYGEAGATCKVAGEVQSLVR